MNIIYILADGSIQTVSSIEPVPDGWVKVQIGPGVTPESLRSILEGLLSGDLNTILAPDAP